MSKWNGIRMRGVHVCVDLYLRPCAYVYAWEADYLVLPWRNALIFRGLFSGPSTRAWSALLGESAGWFHVETERLGMLGEIQVSAFRKMASSCWILLNPSDVLYCPGVVHASGVLPVSTYDECQSLCSSFGQKCGIVAFHATTDVKTCGLKKKKNNTETVLTLEIQVWTFIHRKKSSETQMYNLKLQFKNVQFKKPLTNTDWPQHQNHLS